jgi:sec-independent protein translocase protein TatB
MFDVGFWELALVGLIALLVFGPDKLPRVAREAALWIKKFQNMANQAKREIHQELELQELTETLKQTQQQLKQVRNLNMQDLEKTLDKKPAPLTQDKTSDGAE